MLDKIKRWFKKMNVKLLIEIGYAIIIIAKIIMEVIEHGWYKH